MVIFEIPSKEFSNFGYNVSVSAGTFQRIHRSHIVNLKRVDEVSDMMVNIAGEKLPVSPAMRGDFMKRLNVV